VLRVIARLNLGGPAHQASLLSGRRLDPDRYETLLVHGQLAAGEESMADLADAEGARTEFLPTLVQPVDPRRDLVTIRRLSALIAEFRPHLIHTHTAKAGFVGRSAAELRRDRPVIVHTFHGHVLEGYFGAAKTQLFRSLERLLARRTDALIGVSDQTVADLVRLRVAPPERFRTIPLGLDLQPFAEAGPELGAALRAEAGLEPDEIVFTFVGRMVPIKRVDLLLGGFARAVRSVDGLRLVLVGDGRIRPRMEELARDLGVGDRVNFLGYRRDLARIAAASDVAVISSANEGTPVSLIEAAAAGVPAVAADVGGVRTVVDERTGVLFPSGDEAALAQAIEALAGDPPRRRLLGAEARRRALAKFSIDRLIGDIDRLYRELLGPRARTG
jgi:glycosyltransferase involved in cell wall biosynthesis